MASEPTTLRLHAEFDNSPAHLSAVIDLLEAGATPDFICHYRRDETGDMGGARVFEISERLHFLEDLETRKQAIRDQAAEKDKLDDALRATLIDCFDQDLLDDIYQTFRPSRRTAGVQAREKGLGDLADRIRASQMGDQGLAEAADALMDAEKDLMTRESVLEGVLHILAEGFAADPVLRGRFRRELASGILKSTVIAPNRKGASRYADYAEYEQPVRRVQSNHLLNLWRGEREGILKVSLGLPPDKGSELIRKHARIGHGEDTVLAQFLELIFQHAADNLLQPSCEADVRHQIKDRVDHTTAENLARNLRSQLMAPPLGNKKTLGIRASRNTVWLAVLDEDGSIIRHLTLNLDTDEKRAESLTAITALIETEKPEGIALPHGRHHDVTSALVKEACSKTTHKMVIVPVDEAASAVHATGAAARKQWPGMEVGIRTAISLANRLQDSMHELLGLDPKALGLGHTLDEVHQGLLTRTLDQTIASCVAKIGMDVNRAGISHLSRVPGLTRDMAKRIFDQRKKDGSFRSLAALRENDLLSADEFLQVAGFLRVSGGDQPLDATGIHPDDYPLVEKIAEREGCTTADLLHKHLKIPPTELADDQRGPLRVRDVLAELQHYGEDVRGKLTAVHNEGVNTIDELRADMELRGRVTNLTEFGAFVDLGIHQDGLVHISQIPAGRMRDPNRMLAVGEVITVFVLQVDPGKKRISLSMHQPRHLAEGRQPTIGERLAGGSGRGRRTGRGRDAAPAPLSRAARAPDGRRAGGRRGAPRPAGGGAGVGGGGRSGFGGGRGPGRDRDRGSRDGPPRVIIVESDRPIEDVRGHKGEFTSLSSLANLLGGGKPAEPTPPPPAPEPVPAAEPTPPPSPEPVASDPAAEPVPTEPPAGESATEPPASEPAAAEPTATEPAPTESPPGSTGEESRATESAEATAIPDDAASDQPSKD